MWRLNFPTGCSKKFQNLKKTPIAGLGYWSISELTNVVSSGQLLFIFREDGDDQLIWILRNHSWKTMTSDSGLASQIEPTNVEKFSIINQSKSTNNMFQTMFSKQRKENANLWANRPFYKQPNFDKSIPWTGRKVLNRTFHPNRCLKLRFLAFLKICSHK